LYGQYRQQFTGPQGAQGMMGYMANMGMQSAQGMQGMQGMQNQQQNQIKNPQSNLLPQVKGPKINDRDNLNLALAQEKYITDNLNIFAREAGHRQLHNDVMRIFAETHSMTRELFNLMFRKGWYTLEGEQQQKLARSYQKFQGYSTQFPYTNQMH